MLKWLWLSALALVLDQASKIGISSTMQLYESIALIPSLSLTYVHNKGASFSFLSEAGGWQRWLFAALAAIVSTTLSIWLARLQKHETLLAVAIALILGGAVGNLIDRLIYGYVIDFVDFYVGTWHFAIFNIADAAISVGVGLMLLESLGVGKPKESGVTQ
ncbi:signal peptidase II [Methylovulum psychrotolerans]|uniref:Lipoprotein signal peptidase n=1 Tax=Methylovulum psychrotolerans TaxID=1704499 RepID=A0A2S5CQ22_9GAMM|nr:signal peptidase II [Methylovulum psychrotolerans]POZ52910.1 lipoprotein signal peptidase [Methylovulum psychrotolerans]